jgi:hypothetical protein
VRAGYASILVSRTRGAGPLLRPATPSRFESATRPGDFSNDTTSGHDVDATPEVAAAPPQVERPTHQPPASPPQPWAAQQHDEPLLGLRRPEEEWGSFDSRAVRPDEPGHWAAIDDQPDRRRRLGPIRAPRSGRSGMPGEHAAMPPASEPNESANDPSALVDSPSAIEAPRASPQPIGAVERVVVTRSAEHEDRSIGAVEGVVVTRRAEHEDRPADRSSAMVNHGGGEPPIIVRIGRLDVRAVQAPPAPRPEARRRRQVGPTLEERLLARDRQ